MLSAKNIEDIQLVGNLEKHSIRKKIEQYDKYEEDLRVLLENKSVDDFHEFKKNYYKHFCFLSQTRLDLIISDLNWKTTIAPVRAVCKFKQNIKN